MIKIGDRVKVEMVVTEIAERENGVYVKLYNKHAESFNSTLIVKKEALSDEP